MQHPLGDTAHQLGLGFAKGGCSGRLVTGRDGFLHAAQEGADARTAGFVDLEASLILAGALLGLGRICHGV
jgi:hypothetical protein